MKPLLNDAWVMLKGVEDILEGIATPLVISIGASLVRVALVGWHGIRNFVAIFFVSIFMGVMTHWVLAGYQVNSNITAAVTCASALLSKDFLDMLMSEKVRHAVRDRLIHEIHNFRRGRHGSESSCGNPGDREKG